MLNWPLSLSSVPEILCAPSTASGGQPIFLEMISAASLVLVRMKRWPRKIARVALRMASLFFLIPSSDTYWIWLIHIGVTWSRRPSTFDLP